MEDHPVWDLPVRGATPGTAAPELLRELSGISSATACAKLHAQGIRRTFVSGPRPLTAGQAVVGRVRTLQFMPQREDVASGLGHEYVERHTALWAVLEAVEPGDVLMVQAYGSTHTGCFGDMLVRYFQRKGGAGIVVDGCIRDLPRVRQTGLPIWSTGATPHYASQAELFPWAYDVPIACGGVLVLPGDLVVADDDGAVVVPRRRAEAVVAAAREHEEWERFSRARIEEGGALADYYPLTAETRAEYERWRDRNSA
ncbi:ribonuclease activity regulator RraA [Streptomyces sp. MP131-18]|uniref:RraA family protein n=1 Tax=Streptomyces sp. MP131-18 TaxID=1857892 RepID=UPI0009D4E396|nr:ribonuclease activity regulator RraA [Streptomyces sp. MP131-18]ONK09662.1 4-hydroxy-2-oxoglutarate aldolase [Streptomyces sp. MP131-18]